MRAAYPAIKTVDPTSTVLFGALAPNGDNVSKQNARTRPLAFIRSLGCVKVTLKRDRSGPCKGFKALTGDGLAYHPHATTLAPNEQQAVLDNASIGDIPRLERTLDATQRSGGLKKAGAGKFPLYFTEWGYQTRPPDRTRGVSLAQQSRYLQQGAYVAYRNPRVRLLTQYEWRDEPVRRSTGGDPYAGWQSGLRFVNDKPKPAFKSFANPFFIDQRPGSRAARLWGQVAPADPPRHRGSGQGGRAALDHGEVSRPTAAASGRCARRSRRPPTTASAGSPPISTARRPVR